MNIDIKGKDSLLISKSKISIVNDLSFTAENKYIEYCNELNINPSISKGSFDGDDNSWFIDTIFNLESEINFSSGFMYSSEGAFGLYNVKPININSTNISLNNISRMYVTSNTPILLFTFRVSSDMRSENTKWNENENGYCIYAQHRNHNSNSNLFKIAIQVSKKGVRFFFEKVNDNSHRMYINVLEGNNTTNTTLQSQYHISDFFHSGDKTEISVELKKLSYKSYGKFIYKKNVSNVIKVIDSNIEWEQSNTENTIVKLYTAIISKELELSETNYVEQPFNTSKICSIEKNQNLENKYFYIIIEMESNNEEETPTLKNLKYEIKCENDNRFIQLETKQLERFNNVKEGINIKYDQNIGTLRGHGGNVGSFEVDFNPEELKELLSKFGEFLKAKPHIGLDLIEIYYNDIYVPSDKIKANVYKMNLNLIPIDILNP